MSDDLTALVVAAHAASTWFMVGLIWFVQVVHYPLMAEVSPERRTAYAIAHQRRTTSIVAVAMLIEAITAATIATGNQPLGWVGLGLLGIVWVSTFAVQVPLHTRLAAAGDERVVRRLVGTNWVRTAAWSGRGVIALLLLPWA